MTNRSCELACVSKLIPSGITVQELMAAIVANVDVAIPCKFSTHNLDVMRKHLEKVEHKSDLKIATCVSESHRHDVKGGSKGIWYL